MAHHIPHNPVSAVLGPLIRVTNTHTSSFLLSTHYTHYDPWLFAMNLTALIALLVPRLPQVIIAGVKRNVSTDPSHQLHRQRVRFLTEDQYQSGVSTPVEATFPASGSVTPVNGRTIPITLKESHFH